MYNAAGQLELAEKPDGRSETFGYAANGKLASITEIGWVASRASLAYTCPGRC
ncbi:MAG: RHS repeat domain-containing protein [Thermoanaerobaculia bacterium]